MARTRSAYLVAPTAVVGSPGRSLAAPRTMRHTVVPRNCSRSSSGPVSNRARIWLSALTRAWRAERSAVRRARMASTFPVPGLGLGDGVTREHGLGGGDGVDGIGLAVAAPALAIGTAHLDRLHPLEVEEAGEPSSIGPGSLDAKALDLAELLQPTKCGAIAGRFVANDSTPSSVPRSSSAATTWTSRWVSTPPVIRRVVSVMVVMAIPSSVRAG